MKNKIIIGLAILTLALSGYLLYDSFNGEMSKAEVQAQFDDLRSEYEVMQKDLENAFIVQGTLNEQMLSQKKKIDELMSKQEISEEELKEAKNVMRKMNQFLMDDYKARINKLNNENQLLDTENVDLNALKLQNIKEIQELNKRIESLNNDRKTLNTKIQYVTKESDKKDVLLEYASKLRLSNFVLRSFKVRNNGKEVETDKASRIDRLKLSLDVEENKIAESGNKEIYLVVYKPEGGIASFSNRSTGSFVADGKTMTYSDKINIDYTKGEQKQIELVWDSEDFQRGDYVMELYEKDSKTGQTLRIGKVTKTLE